MSELRHYPTIIAGMWIAWLGYHYGFLAVLAGFAISFASIAAAPK